MIGGDSVTFNTTTSAFTDWNVGSNKTINITGASLGGAQAGNYSLGSSTGSATANITAKPLSVSGLTASDKIYDGTTATAVTGTASFGGVIAGDTVNINTSSVTGQFTDKNVGSGKTINLSGVALSGAEGGNYTVAGVSGVSAAITAKALTMSGLSSANKVYDGTTTALVSGTAALQAAITAGAGSSSDGKAYDVDSVSLTGTATGTFSSKDVGSDRTVSFSGKSLAGAGRGNYTLMQQGDDTGKNITAKETQASTPVPPSLLQIQSNTPSATQLPPAVLLATAPNREGIFVSLIRQPSVNVNGAASVSLPKDTVAMREGFSFPLPTKIAETISDQSTLQITTLQGAPLPSWLHYDVDTKIFAVSAVPNGILPMQVLITIDQQQTSIVIYERAN